MNLTKETIIGGIVAEDYRAAGLFQQLGIDFCCNGNRSIEVVSNENNMTPQSLIEKLEHTLSAQAGNQTNGTDYRTWPLDLLADYVEKKHHRYVTTQVPILKAFLEKINKVHGGRHPELQEIKDLFDAGAAELMAHMKKEEQILFPYIRKMVAAKEAGESKVSAPFGSVQNPIHVMMQEHDTEGVRFRKINELSQNYLAPADGCTTYRAAFATLKEFEEDLHLHIHLENNILFPKAILLEASFNN